MVIDKFNKFHKLTKLNTNIELQLTEINQLINSDFVYILKLLYKHNIHKSWYKLFIGTHIKLVPILKQIDELRNTESIFPPANDIFKVFRNDIDKIKIVLLGQDPYPKKRHANGLSFSVNKDIVMAQSVYNIFKEIKAEFPERKYNFLHGDLQAWNDKGIFLLNSALTVIEGKSNSQQNMWTWFTDLVIKYICIEKSNIVFLLFGANAINKSNIINDINVIRKKNKDDKFKQNHIVTGVHPSPLSAHRGFFGSNVFRLVEEKLGESFDWSIYE